MLTTPTPDPNGADRDRHPLLAEGAGYGTVAADLAATRAGVGHFSPAGLTEFKARVDAYAKDLARESARVAERHQADVVSPAYVKQASGYLVARTRDRKLAALGALGAMLLGVALPPLMDLLWVTHISGPRVLVSAAFAVAGTLLMTFRHARE